MTDFKELTPNNYIYYAASTLLEDKELEEMRKDYSELQPQKFAFKYRYLLFRPALLLNSDKLCIEPIQMNYCTNPFCAWYGLPQKRYEDLPNKPYRYKLTDEFERKRLKCNDIQSKNIENIPMCCQNETVSNWSIAEEIRRLTLINKVIPKVERYNFHRKGCPNLYETPFKNRDFFYNRGKSTGNSIKWQCKECKKITNVLPDYKNNYTYDQNKNDILPDFAELLVSRTPVKRICNVLKISPKTYYHKLEWLYVKCLQFLERYETKEFKDKTFDQLWLNTDKFSYYLNNVMKKGQGEIDFESDESTKFQTFIVASSDLKSRYVFRADAAYDFNVTLEDIDTDTKNFYADHLYKFARKNQRLRIPFSPQPPAMNDTQNQHEYEQQKKDFDKRNRYIEGCHVNSTYTAIAHYYLLKKILQTKEWCFISDEDSSLIDPVMRVFVDEINAKTANYFLCKVDKSLSLNASRNLSQEARYTLKEWAKLNEINLVNFSGDKYKMLNKLASLKLGEDLKKHNLYDYVSRNGKNYPVRARNPIKHPLPSRDEGRRFIDCITDMSDRSLSELADYLVQVDSHSINIFFEKIRRSLSVLERPLVSSRGEGKSYIYANYNPKYAQYAITILRTFYNFCWSYKSGGMKMTPAQSLGITNKQFKYEDIIYFR